MNEPEKTKCPQCKKLKNEYKYEREDNRLKPMFKWTGGKRREIIKFEKFFPDFVKEKKEYSFIEPFVGAGAVYFYLNNINGTNIINDFDYLLVNFYSQIKNGNKILNKELLRMALIRER